MTDVTPQPEVVIAGGGPVGMGLAIELGQRGIRTTVVERHHEPQPVPKGQNLTQRTMEHLHVWGVDQAIRDARPIPKGTSGGGIVAYRELFGSYSYDWLHRSLVGAYYFQENERLPQYETENVLRRRVASLPCVNVRYGWDVVHVAQDLERATVILRTHRGSEEETLDADYVVGCDGTKSVVRDGAGIATKTLSGHQKLMVLVVFRSTGLHRMLDERYPGKAFFCVLHPELSGYWRFFGRVDLQNTFFFHAPVPEGTTRDNFDFPSLVQRAAGRSFDVDIRYLGFWDLRFIVAQRYEKNRVFIAGDAAHSHPPYGGYGINTGFEDARNLGWKLAAYLRGWGGTALLASYSEERQPVFQSTADDFIAKAIDSDREFLNSYDPSVDRHAFEERWASRAEGAKAEVDMFAPGVTIDVRLIFGLLVGRKKEIGGYIQS